MYDSSYRPSTKNKNKMFGDSIDYNTGDARQVLILKSTPLYNTVINSTSPTPTSKSNLYFFTSSSGAPASKSLFEAMGYEFSEYYENDFYLLKNKKEKVEKARDIYLSSNFNAPDGINTRIIYKFYGPQNSALNDEDRKEDLESLVSRVFLSIGDNLLLKMLHAVLGNTLSVDSLIFNKYEQTKIDLYNTSATGVNKALRDTINYWFKIILAITYVAYLIILIYIGIMIVVSAGTAQQDKMKKYLTDWIVGLAILMFLPTYGIPFLFKLNDGFVRYLSRDVSSMNSYYNEYDINVVKDILGSDSATVGIEEVLVEMAKLEEEQETVSGKIDLVESKIIPVLRDELRQDGIELSQEEEEFIVSELVEDNYIRYKGYRQNGETSR